MGEPERKKQMESNLKNLKVERCLYSGSSIDGRPFLNTMQLKDVPIVLIIDFIAFHQQIYQIITYIVKVILTDYDTYHDILSTLIKDTHYVQYICQLKKQL